MSLLVVGSAALDSVKTPFGSAEEVLGGSAVYFSASASFFTRVRLVAVVGEDFPEEHLRFLGDRGVDLEGIERGQGATFRWRGEYGYDLNEPRTLETQLNVFERFGPKLPLAYRSTRYVFLANIDPELQQAVLDQVESPRLVALDTMNFWIAGKGEALRSVVRNIHTLIINESETRQLAEEPNVVRAARKVLTWGPQSLVVKRGEYGALYFSPEGIFAAPAYPLDDVFDPTGAGDSFAGGFMGYLAASEDLTPAGIRRAIVFGSVMASFAVEAFSLERLRTLRYAEVEARYREFTRLVHFEPLE